MNRFSYKILILTLLFQSVAAFNVAVFAQKNNRKVEQTNIQVRNISLDFMQASGKLNTMFKECIGAGRANEGLRADWQAQLRYVKAECGFKYIRMHGILEDDMGIYQEDKAGNPIYNWQYLDMLFDFLLSIEIKPFVEFGFMPKALASGAQTIFWWKGNITPPKDYQKWEDLIRNFTQHYTERYGAEELKTWYFEVWNEPNLKDLFWSGDQADYFKLYATAAKAVKSVSQAYRVGGPATAGSAWIPEFIDFCVKNEVPVDFISTHTYGVDGGFLDAQGNRGTVLSKNPQAVYGEVLRSRQQIAASARPDLELHYTEWSSSYTPTDPIHDSYHQAAYILDKLKKSGNAPNSMSYWVFTDIFEENGIRTTPFHGGFGLLNYQFIKKPAFYAYQFLNRLGEIALVNNDTASIACKDAQGNFQLLLWDFTATYPDDAINNQVYYKRDLPAKPKGEVNISLKNLPKGNYLMKIYQTGYQVNDAYSTYQGLGSPQQLSSAQVKAIQLLNSGEPTIQKLINTDSSEYFEQSLKLRENEVFLITRNKI